MSGFYMIKPLKKKLSFKKKMILTLALMLIFILAIKQYFRGIIEKFL